MGDSRLARALTLAAVLVAGPLSADWLVLEDGTRMETSGPWEERGKLVVFTTTDGMLASLRATEVDLEASRRATAEPVKPPAKAAPPAAEPPKPEWVLTDADVAHAPNLGDESEAAPDTGGVEERLVVTDYQEAPMADEQGTRITGTLRNVSTDAATQIRLSVLAYDASGDLLDTASAMLSAQALMPDQQARFQVDFEGVFAIAAVVFRPTTLPLDVGEAEAESGSEAPEAVAEGSPSG